MKRETIHIPVIEAGEKISGSIERIITLLGQEVIVAGAVMKEGKFTK